MAVSICTSPVLLRAASPGDEDAIWQILEPVIRAGETYALPRGMSRAEALAYWLGADRETLVAEADGALVGTYYLRPNQAGGGAHIANCGYMTRLDMTGRGVARGMCLHSLGHAASRGYAAMQFNFVLASNVRALALWQGLGFQIVGRIPRAFQHPRLGLVDAFILHRPLSAEN